METRQLKQITGGSGAVCTDPYSMPRVHGKLMSGTLSAKRSSRAPAICPDCGLLVRPLLYEKTIGQEHMARATLEKLAMAVVDCIRAGAQIINLTLALSPQEPGKKGHWNSAFNYALSQGVLINKMEELWRNATDAETITINHFR